MAFHIDTVSTDVHDMTSNEVLLSLLARTCSAAYLSPIVTGCEATTSTCAGITPLNNLECE